MKRNAATERQVQAADPASSTWLSANAGSGKTRVLTDRVARLLLSGVLPQHILCLTYTKAAASEMQNRLFQRLGEWAMLADPALKAKLRDLGIDTAVDNTLLRDARRLFARAIETPGGLKIQTIHSFCASLLRRFPLEAGVSPQFIEMDERAAKRLQEDVLEDLANRQDPKEIDGIARFFTGEDLGQLIAEISKHRALFTQNQSEALVWQEFDLPKGYDAQSLLSEVFLGDESALIASLVNGLLGGSTNDVKAGTLLKDAKLGTLDGLEVLEAVFLTKGGKSPFSAKIGSVPTKKTAANLADIMPAVEKLMLRVEVARARRVALGAAQKTWALHQFAHAFLPLYEQRKQQQGWLDFDDLILRTRDLLIKPGVAEWVLYRLDGGIDHILVDEAQDTSPAQWQVIDLIAQEFTAGEGARSDIARTIFVVGDQKQSIYSFQGADPDKFDAMRAHFHGRLEAVGVPFQNLLLEYSFRSSEAILRLVDTTFEAKPGLGNEIKHRAFKEDLPGRVDLWPVIEKAENPDPPHWSDPVDTLAPQHHTIELANQVAREIRTMLDQNVALTQHENGEPIHRAVQPGDFLILVQRRSELFHEIIRACKAEGLPIAGADRLKIGGELAVKDLTALLAFLATPEDDLSLACALKSPLFGWDEQALFQLAAGREEKYLWSALRTQEDAHPETLRVLTELRDDADFLRPYDLLERVLTRYSGRQNLIARLGLEAEDGIDAMLAQALNYERLEVPSLTGFLTWLQSGDVEIKRQLDSAGNQIRVMTVHGAKGLEAPIVILPDTAERRVQIRDEVYLLPSGVPVWKTATDQSPAVLTQARADILSRQNEERQRLLYVAMTRAEQWLIVCAAGNLGNGDSWYQQIEAGLHTSGAVEQDFRFGKGLRLESGNWVSNVAPAEPAQSADAAALQAWATTRAITPDRADSAITPSDLGGAKALPGKGLDEEAAMRRGTLIHLLLEHLPRYPEETWPDAMLHILPKSTDPALLESVFSEASRVLTQSALSHVFAADTQAEVDISGTIDTLGPVPVHGTIDRLIVTESTVIAVDFKSNETVPASSDQVPEGLLRQMGAYGALLRHIFPDHTVETAILWTKTAQLMPLADTEVTAALQRAANP